MSNNLGWIFDYGELKGGDINLSDAASIDVSGNGSGNIQIQGNAVNLTDGSAIFAETEGDAAGGLTAIRADEVNIIGTDPDLYLSSSIWSDVYFDATGNGGSVLIETGNLLLEGGGQINTNTFSLGNAGDITVRATDIKVIGESDGGDFFSALSAQADIFFTGKGGDILVETNRLYISDGAQISTTTFGEADGGNLTIEANDIELNGNSDFGASGLFVSTEAEGNSGNLIIETELLKILDGAQILSLSSFTGKGGQIDIKANDIKLKGESELGSSGIFAPALSSGDGGKLNIQTRSLAVTEGGQIGVSTRGSGNAGTLNIAAEDITLSGGSGNGASGIIGSATVDTGNGGNLNIESDNLSVHDGANISVSNFLSRDNREPGQGKAGSINIKANAVEIDNTTSEFASSITASTNNSGGGEIELNIAENITLSNNSEITADTKGDGDGGNIQIAANNLDINNQARISVDSIGLGNAGDINLSVNNLDADRGRITATSQQSGGGDLNLTTDFIDLQNNSEISTSVLNGDGGGGNITINSNYVLGRGNSDIRANAFEGDGGNIDITTDVILLSFDSEVDASSEFGLDGVVEIDSLDTNKRIGIVNLPEKIVDPSALITAVCPVKDGETLVTTGKGGLAENPRQNLRGESLWEDLRDVTDQSDFSEDLEVIEAKAWNINQQGKVELLSYVPQEADSDRLAAFNQCRK